MRIGPSSFSQMSLVTSARPGWPKPAQAAEGHEPARRARWARCQPMQRGGLPFDVRIDAARPLPEAFQTPFPEHEHVRLCRYYGLAELSTLSYGTPCLQQIRSWIDSEEASDVLCISLPTSIMTRMDEMSVFSDLLREELQLGKH